MYIEELRRDKKKVASLVEKWNEEGILFEDELGLFSPGMHKYEREVAILLKQNGGIGLEKLYVHVHRLSEIGTCYCYIRVDASLRLEEINERLMERYCKKEEQYALHR